MPEENPRGRFVWYDLMTSDPEAARAFYTAVLPWGTTVWEGGGPMPYTMWTANGAPFGGVMKLPADAQAPPHWLAYVSTPDVRATVERATELGAKVWVPPSDIPDTGTYAVLADPQGATFGVYASASPAQPDAKPEVGEHSWHELTTTDHPAAFDFYADLFGWVKTEAMDMGPMGVYQMYGYEGRTLGGMFNAGAEMPKTPFWLHYVRIGDDVNQVVEKVKQLGGQVANGPMEVPGGDWVAQLIDPQGAFFAVHQVMKSA